MKRRLLVCVRSWTPLESLNIDCFPASNCKFLNPHTVTSVTSICFFFLRRRLPCCSDVKFPVGGESDCDQVSCLASSCSLTAAFMFFFFLTPSNTEINFIHLSSFQKLIFSAAIQKPLMWSEWLNPVSLPWCTGINDRSNRSATLCRMILFTLLMWSARPQPYRMERVFTHALNNDNNNTKKMILSNI